MLLDTLLALLQGWAPAFPRQRTCQRAIALALGLLCGLGRRTLTRALCFLGRQPDNYPQVFWRNTHGGVEHRPEDVYGSGSKQR